MSLLNTDYKITSILANRPKVIILDIIDTDQCGFITGRLLADNISCTITLIDYAQKQNEDLLLITDAEKAFDLVS